MNSPTPSAQDTLRRRRRTAFILLGLLFLAPVAISFYLYYGGEGWRPKGNTSHGDLVTPARPLPEVALPTPEGKPTDAKFLHGKWSLIYVGRLTEGKCDKRCQDALYQIRQVRLSLNEKSERVQRVMLYAGSCCEQPFFSREHEGLVLANVDGADGQRLLREFSAAGSVLDGGRIYISDPLGNLMMSYPPTGKAEELLDDLKRLLKLSHIG